MSSIETGSSAIEHVGAEDQRPGEHRSLLLATREIARVLVHELLRRRQARRARGPRRPVRRSPSARSRDRGSAAGGRPLRRSSVAGLSDACGSWKTICRRCRRARSSPRARPRSPRPRNGSSPSLASTSPSRVRPERRLARPRLADDPEHLALAQLEADAVDRLDRPRLAAAHAVEERAAQREVRPSGR